MSRILILLRILIIGGALASVFPVHASNYALTRLELVNYSGVVNGWQTVNAHEILRLALTAIGLSLL